MKLRCPKCDVLVAELEDGVLILRQRHHGQWHEVRVRLFPNLAAPIGVNDAVGQSLGKALHQNPRLNQKSAG